MYLNQLLLSRSVLLRCFVLLVLSWPGPRPIVHSHSQFGNTAKSNFQMDRHIARYHSNGLEDGVRCDLAHLHWAYLPSDVSDSGSGSVGSTEICLGSRVDDTILCPGVVEVNLDPSIIRIQLVPRLNKLGVGFDSCDRVPFLNDLTLNQLCCVLVC